MVQHVHQIAFDPLVEIAVITVPALGHLPLVERLDHHHESHLVAQFDQRLGRHVVRRADGVAAMSRSIVS